jgi:transposase
MQVMHERCCGLDVHKKTVVACVLVTSSDGRVERAIRTFGTMTRDLLTLSDWLDQFGVTHVVLESTGVYWRPVFNVLEDGRVIVLVNPQHLKTVPGRKTDVKDSEWLADLLRHGLLKPSFIPPAPVRELRELTRYRKTLVQARTDEINRLQKVLEGANLKLAVVVSDVLGASARAMLAGVLGGEQDPETLAELARGRLRTKLPALRRALEGRVKPHHLVLIGQTLAHIDFLEESTVHVQHAIEQRLGAFAEAVELLQTIPGVGAVVATALVAEIGTDVSRFLSAKHLASWVGVCPGNKESAGKRLSGRTTKGNVWVRGMLAEAVWSIAQHRGTHLHAQYHRLARRRGKLKAAMAVAHSVLVIAYCLLGDHQPYTDLGADYLEQRDAARVERHHVQRLQQLGYTVTLTHLAA